MVQVSATPASLSGRVGVRRDAVVMDIAPTEEAFEALYERDRKAAARSMQHLLRRVRSPL